MAWLAAILTIVFTVLKLCEVITWSWIWVLAPIWIYIILLAVVLVLFFNMVSNSGRTHFI